MSANAARSISAAVPMFAALGDATRLRLVAKLSEGGPLSIAKLTEGTDMTRQGLTKHLQVLEDAGVVRSARRGRETVYALHRRKLEEAQRWLSVISGEWDDTLTRLKAFVEVDS
jgi:DNA-binding transcriptional ArsR family regulator